MTWNIHGGVGVGRTFDLERIARTVSGHSPDIVALQEVDSRHARSFGAFEILGNCLGGHCAEARLVEAADGDYGHVLVSRWPLAAVRIHPLSVDGREPRAAIEAVIETPGGPLHVVAAHLGLGLGERNHQAGLLRAVAGNLPERAVMMGDFNDWVWGGAVRRALTELFPASTPYRTFPSFAPVFKLDRIYCRPRSLLLRHAIDRAAWRASDHLPVLAELDPSVP